jgi:hypothetical protein
MVVMKWIIVAIVLSPFVVRLSFFGVCTAKRLLESGIKLTIVDRLVAYFLLAIGVPADIIYNWTIGVIRFREFRGITYSSRIQYYWTNHTWQFKSTRRHNLTHYWHDYLNTADPGHIN